MNKIELLAPAKDLECGIAAINCGADAVYIGAGKFGARASVGNSLEDIEKLVSYAHIYRAKVYATVNTILNNREIEEAGKLIEKLYKTGVDAVIIQDMGLLELNLPTIPFIASTQTHNNTPDKVLFLEKAGFKRVILARELSLEKIREIRDKTSIELEFFIHGSLCVSYSGQCYLSYVLGGKRSGNRGVCAQPCRKLYSLVDGEGNFIAKNRYLLSLKDLNLTSYIKDLIDAGIVSFKIEGRLKDISYVKNIVSFYREEIDKVLEAHNMKKSSLGKSFVNFTPDCEKTFNRGYTDYFIKERSKDISSLNTCKSLGKPLGRVTGVKGKSFIMEKDFGLNSGDGICFFDENNNLLGTYVNRADGRKVFPADIENIKAGIFIYRNLDSAFIKRLKSAKTERNISLELTFTQKGEKLTLEALSEDGFSASASIEVKPEPAKNREIASANMKKQLSKFGGTEFMVSDLHIHVEDIYFIPVKDLNRLRRNLTDELRKKREEGYVRDRMKIRKNDYPYPQEKLSFKANVMNSYAEKFYERHGAKVLEPAAETGLNLIERKVMTTKLCLKYQFGLCPQYGGKDPGPLYLLDDRGQKYRLNFNCKDCEMEIIF
jgi:collagenase-like PrtC family protease